MNCSCIRTVRLARLALAAGLALTAASAAAADHASVNADTQPAPTGLTFRFKVAPAQGLHINLEGPWKLELTQADGLSFAKTVLTKAEMDAQLPGFAVATQVQPAKPTGDVAYKLTAFVCTDDKTQCFRDVLAGKVGWTTAAK